MFTNEIGELKAGDRITVSIPGFTATGTVLSASFYGPRDGWFIEMKSDGGRYHYWKQGSDGGSVVRA